MALNVLQKDMLENPDAGYNQETAKQANASATFDYNVYMNGSPSAAAKETTVNDVNFNKATAPAAAEKPAAKPLFTDEANMVGNTVGNIVNEGVVAKQGEWIYYSNSGDKGTLYKERTNGTDKQKISDEVCFCINVVGEWIYYRNNSDGGKLYKIRIDGTERTKMLDDSVDCVSVVDNVIYFVNYTR